jgi:toxin-antitoxin system PIN domain toxin
VLFLPDVNVWLALAFDQHAHHAAARGWFDAGPAGAECLFCRYTQMGFLRLATNPKANPLQTCTMTLAWQVYDAIRLHPRIAWADEPAGLDPIWRGFTFGATFSTHVWNDAYLAALAVAGGYRVVTFDSGFTQFAGVAVTILL